MEINTELKCKIDKSLIPDEFGKRLARSMKLTIDWKGLLLTPSEWLLFIHFITKYFWYKFQLSRMRFKVIS